MPLTKRSVSPVDVSRYRLPANVRQQELECVANGTLANLVRQLSSMSRHAEDIFGELYHEAVKLEHKSNTLHARVDRLAMKVTQLDSNEEEVSLQDMHLRKPYKSSTLLDQQSLSRQTLPTAMSECYGRSDRPPELDKLNQYRDDTKSGLKFYTDPEYFFELWRKDMLSKDTEPVKRPKHPRPRVPSNQQDISRRKRPRQPEDHRHKYFAQAIKDGEYIGLPAEYQTPEFLRQQQAMRQGTFPSETPRGMVRPESLEGLHQQPNGQPSSGYGSATDSANSAVHQQYMQHARVSVLSNNRPPASNYQPLGTGRPVVSQYMEAGYGLRVDANKSLGDSTATYTASPTSSEGSRSRSGSRPSQPPPAPPPLVQNGDLPHLAQLTIDDSPGTPLSNGLQTPVAERVHSPDLPPPPPEMIQSMQSDMMPSPPPEVKGNKPKSIPPPPPPPPGVPNGIEEARSSVVSVSTKSSQIVDKRSDLLRAIRDGIHLKKVDRQEEKDRELEAAQGHDVAAILRKRMEDVYGRSDTESDPEEFDDDWDD